MNEEIKRILKLLEEGKINSDQASELIDAIKDESTVPVNTNIKDKHLKINVLRDGKKKVNLTFPLRFAKAILKATGKLPIKVNGVKEVDFDQLKDSIEKGENGRILDVNTSDGGKVEMIIE
jgi:hypothetical protein